MSPLLTLFVLCALGAISLAVCTGVLIARNRKRSAIQPSPPSPVQKPAPEPAPSPALARARARAEAAATRSGSGLPGMPPTRLPDAPPSWAAVERQLEAPRIARGSVPPRRVSPNRFDDVATSGLPVVVPTRNAPSWDQDEAPRDAPRLSNYRSKHPIVS